MKNYLKLFFVFVICLMFSAVAALACEPGQYDASGTCTACPAGYYCPDGVAKINCPKGQKQDPTSCLCVPVWKKRN